MSRPLVDEVVAVLHVNGVPFVRWRCTPTDIEALAIGRLYIDGLIMHADDVGLTVESGDDELVIHARAAERRRLAHTAVRTSDIPDPGAFTELFRELFASTDARHEHGGMHAAAACAANRIVVQVEDVGRHNTIDKLTGALLLAELDPAAYGVLLSARVSGEIAQKCVHAGYSWLASRSIPTSLAVQIAQQARMPIIGRAAGRGAVIYE